jgi:hypothetical protein
MAASVQIPDPAGFRILAITQGLWGERIADNITRYCPEGWTINRWAAPRALPPVIDDPEDYLPAQFPAADLVLALGETAGVIQLVPDIARLSGARAVLAPIDRNESVPPGLAKQLGAWLAADGVALALPKPFCSLTPTTYNQPPCVVSYDNALIRRFAEHFGHPEFTGTGAGGQVTEISVVRDSACGCAHFVAQGLAGCALGEAEYEAGMLHHHYPCLASMNQDADYHDTLMHVSGNIVREAVATALRPYMEPTPYFRPHGRVDDVEDSTTDVG